MLAIGATATFLVISVVLLDHRARTGVRAPVDLPQKQARRTSVIALACVLAGGLVWRIRAADQLADNPLDTAGLVRVGFDCLGAVFGVAAWLQAQQAYPSTIRRGKFSPPVLYATYVVVIVIGMYAAVAPLLVGFRAFELAVMPMVVAAVARCFSLEECLQLAKRVLYVGAASVAVSVALFPSEALLPTAGGIYPYRVEGVLPTFGANTVGTFGIMLFALGLGAKSIERFPVLLGLALVLLTQYRTGMVASRSRSRSTWWCVGGSRERRWRLSWLTRCTYSCRRGSSSTSGRAANRHRMLRA